MQLVQGQPWLVVEHVYIPTQHLPPPLSPNPKKKGGGELKKTIWPHNLSSSASESSQLHSPIPHTMTALTLARLEWSGGRQSLDRKRFFCLF